MQSATLAEPMNLMNYGINGFASTTAKHEMDAWQQLKRPRRPPFTFGRWKATNRISAGCGAALVLDDRGNDFEDMVIAERLISPATVLMLRRR